MFQYALYLRLKSLGKDVKIDDISGFAEDAQRTPVLALFGADYERPEKKELRKMLDSSPFLHAKIRRKLCGRKKKAYFEADKCYRPEILEWDDIYLEGYWQTEEYFRPVEEQVRKVFDTDKLIRYIQKPNGDGKTGSAGKEEGVVRKGRAIGDWLERIGTTESVGVHIRRGDYLLPKNQELFGDICTEAYYRTAMDRMRQEHPGCVFYLFTNDKNWAAQWILDNHSPQGHIEVVELKEIPDDGTGRDYAEFALMSRCKHNIMANSSYSWWASYLNRYPYKTVFAPDRWLNGWNCEDIYRADMQRITVPPAKGRG